ncbi:MAG: protein-L-isoaspartate(D-aspartate) O-methyltransferase [Candidatus Aenigmarchaeota archaeon]|nr:protein-L-isoaspartate(D-aspartate) O-methyltransferase [Candidatus Aenigmarchaeota archaeon]
MDFEVQRKNLIRKLSSQGYVKSSAVKRVMLKVPRELFVPEQYYDNAYIGTPLPIPGDQTISAPHIHSITLENLKLKKGDRFLEVGAGSGIMLAYAQELVGEKGKVVGIEINKETYKFAKRNVAKAGYKDIVLIHGDGSLGYTKYAPYDKIVVSATSPDIPKPLLEQLKSNGTMLIVIGSPYSEQNLVEVKKNKSGKVTRKEILPVVFVNLRGKYGWK